MKITDTIAPVFGALFDLDGVLIDSEGIYTEFWHNIDVQYPTGVENFEYVIKGNTLAAILDRYFPDANVRQYILQQLKEHERTMVYRTFDGVPEFLAALRAAGVPTAVVTSSNKVKMNHLYSMLPGFRQLFDAVITDEDVSNSKPDPEGYIKAAGQLGMKPECCVVFEDSMAGVEAGRRAGGRVVGVATTNPAERLQPLCDIVVDSVATLNVATLSGLFRL